ncbi:LAME_0F00474g1_1 [Lachancea meyersii CBS 8951]|uniref:LAME_0F00474g1_1 n=1 Tax=Lachancea meyersii CBS 8951 TaxID=1266667 RepID=A0A1G4JPB3_9SACH|nr:LAME_0F00474g1_1 [Lachancea meyersii CBS 8951]
MSASASQKPTRFWSKVKSSTKSISSSFAQLSIKQERDGDTVTSTVVHKALVKYYTHREPFEGFPDWLGHKEELPDEQKVLRKQKMHHHDPRSAGQQHSASTTTHTEPVSPVPSQRLTAGTNFRDIYKSATSARGAHSASAPASAAFQDPEAGVPRVSAPPPTQRTSSMLMRERLKRK